MAYTIQKQVTPDYEYMTSFTQNVKNDNIPTGQKKYGKLTMN